MYINLMFQNSDNPQSEDVTPNSIYYKFNAKNAIILFEHII